MRTRIEEDRKTMEVQEKDGRKTRERRNKNVRKERGQSLRCQDIETQVREILDGGNSCFFVLLLHTCGEKAYRN